MPRMSITLTDRQAEALDRIAAETGASKQSMISLAITDWLVQYLEKKIVVSPTEDTGAALSEETPILREVPYTVKKIPQTGSDPVCEVCGAPAYWFYMDENGDTHYTCNLH